MRLHHLAIVAAVALRAAQAHADDYAVVHNGAIPDDFGPQQWNAGAFGQEFAKLGLSVSFPMTLAAGAVLKLTAGSVVPVTRTPPASLDPMTQQAQDGTPSIVTDGDGNPTGVTIVQTAVDLPLSQSCVNRYKAAVDAGVAVAYAGDSGRSAPFLITGIYPLDDHSVLMGVGVSEKSSWLSGFPLGASTYPWPDINGVAHVFTSTTDWKNGYGAGVDYMTALALARATCLGGGGWTAPQGAPGNPISLP